MKNPFDASCKPEASITYSDYIVYVDESGDHSLTSIDPDYPIFVLSFCIFKKTEYTQKLTPLIRKLKFDTFGHDIVVLHESDIRRKKGAFSRLSKEPREDFLNALNGIVTVTYHLILSLQTKKQIQKVCSWQI